MHEAQMHDQNSFLTLTYNPESLPENGTLVLEDWQAFARALRKTHTFRYYHCGEYGDVNKRPHYHAAIFGQDFRKGSSSLGTGKHGHTLWTHPRLEKVWGKGYVTIGSLSFESAAYIARYCMKKVTGQKALDHYAVGVDTNTGELKQLRPEYATMSRRPGLGSSWLAKYYSDVYPSDEVIVNAKSTRPPRFYDSRLEKADPVLHTDIKDRRKRAALPHAENNTPERLAVREACLKAKQTHARRDKA